MYCQLSGSAGEAPEEIDESFFEDEDLIESDEEDETESSADLLIKFLQSMFKKASKHAKKASRSVLPAAISPQLVCLLFFTALTFFLKKNSSSRLEFHENGLIIVVFSSYFWRNPHFCTYSRMHLIVERILIRSILFSIALKVKIHLLAISIIFCQSLNFIMDSCVLSTP